MCVFEAGWLAILRIAGVGTDVAVAFTIGQRILTVPMVAIAALLSQAVYVARRYLAR